MLIRPLPFDFDPKKISSLYLTTRLRVAWEYCLIEVLWPPALFQTESNKNKPSCDFAAVVCYCPFLFVLVRDRDSLGSKDTNTNDAGDDHRDIMALVLLFHGHLQVTTFQALPHMPHEMAWFNVSNRTSAALE